MNRSNSFLIILNVFADYFSCISELETSWSDLILSILRNSSFRWVASFLNDRTAALRLDDKTGGPGTSKNWGATGVASSTNFIHAIYSAVIQNPYKRKKKEGGLCIRGYVDDDLLTCRAKDETLSTSKVQTAFSKVEAWAEENGMIFDLGKFEAIHFFGKPASLTRRLSSHYQQAQTV